MAAAVNPNVIEKEGFIPFTHNGETFQTYYRLFGDLATATRTPLIFLHGGPGLVHNYLQPYSDLAANAGIPVILYDQLGNGKSTHLREKPSTFWTIDLFLDELTNVIKYFGVENGFDLGGHSWGGSMATEFTISRQPQGLKHLIISSSHPGIPLWVESVLQLLQKFPKDVAEGIKVGMRDPDQHYAAMKTFNAVHGCVLKPTPTEYTYTLETVFGKDADRTVASSGYHKDWTAVDRLHLIQVPTLVTNGRADMAQDFVVAPFFKKIEKVKWVTFERSSHTSHIEEREHFMGIVADFLAS